MNLVDTQEENEKSRESLQESLAGIDKELFLESAKTAVAMVRGDGTCIQTNHYFEELFYDANATKGIQNINEIKPSNTYNICQKDRWFSELISKEDSIVPKMEIQIKGGSFYFTVMSTPLFRNKEDSAETYIITLTDITKVVELHKKEIEISKELAYKQGIFDVTSEYIHNIGNIITGSRHYIDKIEKNLTPIQQFSPYFQKIKGEIEKYKTMLKEESLESFEKSAKSVIMGLNIIESSLVDIVKNTINEDLAKLEKAIHNIAQTISYQQEMYKQSTVSFSLNESVDVNSLLKDIRSVVDEQLMDYGIELVVEIEEGLTVFTNKVNLYNGLINLITNAAYSVNKAKQEGITQVAKIYVRAFEERDKELFLELDSGGGSEIELQKKVIFEVEDTGIGIEEESLQKIFTRGFTTKKEGHGLGLHSFANFLKENGGSIGVSSEGLGKGAKFSVLIYNKESIK